MARPCGMVWDGTCNDVGVAASYKSTASQDERCIKLGLKQDCKLLLEQAIQGSADDLIRRTRKSVAVCFDDAVTGDC